ncbi:uncharacterized protein PFL1_02843 [Pseudozyma flocculosa PF-1]|nr:uncharacterized protein PFL1_02843 [Pseudozyma flocculosa PF-1]EPQ29624.1 hypothetical protein PFL1_02843 [Pseudozyma flocculosa PF-1]
MSGHPGSMPTTHEASTPSQPQDASTSTTREEEEYTASFPTYVQSSLHRHNDDDGEGEGEEDDDEALFAELEREVEAMDDQRNYPGSSAAQGKTTGKWVGRGAEDVDGFLRDDVVGDRDEEAVGGFDMAEFRERRMLEIREELARRKQGTSSSSQNSSSYALRGKLTEISHEKELIHLSAQEARVAIHFFHASFERCKLLDRHLEVVARLHPDTLFLRANVLNCPFLTAKLGIKVLPCIVTFRDGVSKDKMVGFEELGNSDRFTTGALEWRLGQSGIVDPRRNQKPILGFAEQQRESVGVGVVGASSGRRRKDKNGRWIDEGDGDEDDYWNDD